MGFLITVIVVVKYNFFFVVVNENLMVEYIALGNGFFGIEGCLFCLRFVFVNDLRFLLLRVLSSTIGRDTVYSDRLNSKRK